MIGSPPPRKPEPSLTDRGRAAAKGTNQEWVRPNTSVSYAQMKANVDAPPVQAPADDLAVRRSPHR